MSQVFLFATSVHADASSGWGGDGPPILFDKKGPLPADVHQGRLGDCYLMASLAAVALTDPQLLKQSVSMSPDGARVRLFLNGSRGRYQSDWVQVDLTPRSEHVFSSLDRRGRPIVWVGLFEMAFAQWLENHHLDAKGHALQGDGLDAIGEGGFPEYVLTALTGRVSMNVWSDALSDEQLRWVLSQPRAKHPSPVVAATLPENRAYAIKPRHAYTVVGVSADGSQVTLRDPGFRPAQADNMPDPQLVTVPWRAFRFFFPRLTYQAKAPANLHLHAAVHP